MNPIILIIPFLAAAIASLLFKKVQHVLSWSVALACIGALGIIAYALPHVFLHAGHWSDAWILFDGLSALMATLIAVVYAAATFVGVHYIHHEFEEGIITKSDLKMYFALFHVFALCMLVTVLANNTLLLWLALEGTTLSSTFLVGLYRRKASIEAAWKYIILCSTGISLGLIGILLMGYDANLAVGSNSGIFTITSLIAHAPLFDPQITKWAFVFLFIGFGAKVGLVPMHTWLPDAHSKAPSPISATFSGILLNVALYAVIRFKFITDAALGSVQWSSKLLLFFGVISVLLPALLMLVQKNYKRMLAYSSVEHMGLITFALALSPIGAVGAVMHMIGHTLTKSMLFFGAGEILIKWKTTKIEKISGMLARAKYTSIFFLAGIVAIIAIPPSALFISEYTMFVDAIKLHPYISIVLFVALGIIAYAMLKLTAKMIFAPLAEGEAVEKETWDITHTIMLVELVLVVVSAFWFTTPHGIDTISTIVKDSIYISQ